MQLKIAASNHDAATRLGASLKQSSMTSLHVAQKNMVQIPAERPKNEAESEVQLRYSDCCGQIAPCSRAEPRYIYLEISVYMSWHRPRA